ncbi:hypothetical protein ACROYT_G003929 [Oculina patagonica]
MVAIDVAEVVIAGRNSIHVSIFASVEYPDKDLVTLLSTYRELKSHRVRHLRFSEEGYKHIENSVRVVEFLRIDRDIPKRVSLGGLDIGFKYSGQPVTCHRCHSLEHMVKNCPFTRRNPVPGSDRSVPETDENSMEVQTTPPPESTSKPQPPPSYAAAATGTADDELSPEQ